ncbi:MAG: TonB-dependent receptor [Bacteroidales bacterium]|nr:TonB-dependent receptor [Bacteroidales bacterium]
MKRITTYKVAVAILCLLSGMQTAMAQTKSIKGVVVDESQTPVISATVQVKGTDIWSVSDNNGKFELKTAKNGMVMVSCIGYETVLVPAEAGKEVTIVLKEESQNLEESVVIGYGAVRKSDLSGAVAAVELKGEAETMPIVSADQFLQGRIAGVNITSNSGAPGAAMNIQIRGVSTLSGDTAPLYVVDGFPIEASASTVPGGIAELNSQPTMNPLAAINPNDIESIQVLKDASATAIYGSRATNGVVMITTKKGKEGKANINYNFRTDISQVAKYYNLLNAYEYGLFENELDRTANGFDISGNVLPTSGNVKNSEATLEKYKTYSTDWQRLMYRTAYSYDHQLSVNGGSESVQYNASLGYTDQQGIIMNTGLERYAFRLGVMAKLSKKLTLRANSSYTITSQQQTSHSQAASMNQMIRRILTTKPYLMPGDKIYEDEDVAYVAADNPYVMATELKDNMKQKFALANASLTYVIIPGLSAKAGFNFNGNSGSRYTYYPIGTNAGNQYNGMAFRAESDRQNMVMETTVNYDKKIRKSHRINAVIGYTYEDRQNTTLSVQVGDFTNNDLLYNAIGEATNTIAKGSNVVRTKMSSFIGRVNYTLLDKYIFTATGRYDGSSILAPENQWAFFPSAAFAWRINQEPFLKSVKEISNIKLRLSYGLTGNQNIGFAAPYAIMNHVRGYIGGEVVHGISNGSLPSPDLGWENTKTYNVGLDLGFFKNRFRITADAYRRDTDNMLMNFGIPQSSGYNTIALNAGQIRNQGVEVEVGADILTKAVKWSVGGNIYLNRNRVIDLDDNEMLGQVYLAGGGVFNSSIHITREGYPIGSFYGYVVDGVYQNEAEAKAAPFDSPQATPGSLRYKDISGPDGLPDGQITADDMTIIGSAEAQFNYGFNTDLSWKGFTLSMIFTGRYGSKIANLNRYFLDSYTDTNDNIRLEAWEGRWQGEGTSNFFPAVDGSKGASYFDKRFSTFLLEDGSYFRLKNLSLAYKFRIKKLAWLKSINVFGTATNLFTLTKYSGYDPEVSITPGAMSPNVDYAAYPSSRTYSFGVNLGF